jgi:prepilin-type N-terminal cleavage/methylation domain-containing protein
MRRFELVLARLRDRENRDAGFSMMEIVVTMTIMAIVLVIFTAGITQAFSAEDRVSAVTTSESQLTIAFQRLDKEIRYASGISTPALIGNDQYVEILSSFTGTPTCTEFRIHAATGQLQQRSWTQGMSPLLPGAWIQLASGVTSTFPLTPATTAFTVSQADSTFNFQRLEVKLTVLSGSNSTATSKQSDVSFTALDTSLITSSGTTCTEGRTVS